MKRLLAVLASIVLIAMPFDVMAASSGSLEQYIQAYDSEIVKNGEVGWAFNRWKALYNEAIRVGNEGLYGTKILQAVIHMTVGDKGNFEANFEKMKENKFLQALAKGDSYDYGLSGVTYLAKLYAKEGGELKQPNGALIASFKSDSKQTSWNIKNPTLLAKELNVTSELIVAWKHALDAYAKRIVYSYSPPTTPKPSPRPTPVSTPTVVPTVTPTRTTSSGSLSSQEHSSLKGAEERIQLACNTLLELTGAENISKIRTTYTQNHTAFACYVHIPQSSTDYKSKSSANAQIQQATRNLMEHLYETIHIEVLEITNKPVSITVYLIDSRNTVICKYENGSW